MSSGFVPLRRGLLDHIERGKMCQSEMFCYILLLLKADHKTGVWWGSAVAIEALTCAEVKHRTAAWALARLEEKGYIKRFITPGKHGNFPILIDRFHCSDGTRTNASDTLVWPPTVNKTGEVDCEVDCEVIAPIQKEENIEKKEKQQQDFVFETPEFKITRAQDSALAAAFPFVDRTAEYAKIRAWLINHPQRRIKRYGAFAQNWFSRIPPPAGYNSRRDADDPGRDTETGTIWAEPPFDWRVRL
ncbi:MAG TPA: hypothetical protein VG206_02740 [Terriglobia bacterium]|nr:hypothetical protein [Terriglobia bacterium]